MAWLAELVRGGCTVWETAPQRHKTGFRQGIFPFTVTPHAESQNELQR